MIMEDILEIIDKIQRFWLIFGQIANTHPFLAWVIGLITILFVICHVKQLLKGAKKLYVNKRIQFYTYLFLLLGLSCLMLFIARYEYSPTPIIIEPIMHEQIIGEGVLLRWNSENSQKEKRFPLNDFRYQIEYHAEGAASELVETYEKYYFLKPNPGKFKWRVRWIVETGDDSCSRWSVWQENELYHSNIQRISITNKVHIGITKDPIAPYYFFDKESKQDRGIDREVAELFAKRIGLKLGHRNLVIQWIPRGWLKGIALALNQHQADFAVAQTTISSERERNNKIKFTIPYLYVPHAIITRNDKYGSLNPTDLQNLRVTAWRNTTGETMARALAKNFIPSDNAPILFHRLNTGEVDAIIDDFFLATYTIKTMPTSLYKYNIAAIPKENVPEKYLSEFGYPDPLGAFVNETATDLLKLLNEIVSSNSFHEEIKKITKQYLSKNINSDFVVKTLEF